MSERPRSQAAVGERRGASRRDRRPWSGRPARRLAGLLSILAVAGCSDGPGPDRAEARQSPADPPLVAEAAVTSYDELPGIRGFEKLDAAGRAAVLARANRTACDCGCVSHTIAHCVVDVEGCEVAERLATGFVDDALAMQRHAGDRPLSGTGDGLTPEGGSGAPPPADGSVPSSVETGEEPAGEATVEEPSTGADTEGVESSERVGEPS